MPTMEFRLALASFLDAPREALFLVACKPETSQERATGKRAAISPRARSLFCQATLAEFSESVVRGAAGAPATDVECLGCASNGFRLTQLFKAPSHITKVHMTGHGNFQVLLYCETAG